MKRQLSGLLRTTGVPIFLRSRHELSTEDVKSSASYLVGRRESAGRRLILPALFLGSLVVIWQIVVVWRQTPRWLMPSPSDIVKAFFESADLIRHHAGITVLEIAMGFTIALILGIAVAVTSHLFTVVRRTVYPLLVISQSVPVIVMAPLLVIWFGFGLTPKIALIVLVCFFPICISFLDGLRAADSEVLSLLKAMGANRWQLFRIGRLPSALPSLAAGAKIAAAYSVIGAVIVEWLGASRGLGVFLIRSQNSFRADRAFVVIVLVSLLAIGLFVLVDVIARWSMPWCYTQQRRDG